MCQNDETNQKTTSEESAGRVFMRSTYYENMPCPSDQERDLPQPPLERPAEEGKKVIPLPKGDALVVPKKDLREAIEERISIRAYADIPLTVNELSWLLWATQGVKKVGFAMGSHRTYRTVPSAGGRHPFETYLAIRSVDGIPSGLYRFLALEHALQEILVQDVSSSIAAICKNQSFITQAAVTFIWVAEAYRTVWRYQNRSYRYIFKDAGHVGQNLYLAASSISCGVCGIGAFDDLALSRYLGIDGTELFPAYGAAVGKLK